jgi:hypothetical protein
VIWMLACAAIENQAPKFVSVAGVEAKHDILTDEYSPKRNVVVDLGEPFAVEVKDPEHQDIAIWVPLAPPGLSFDSDAHTITIDDAGALTATWFGFQVIAQDSSKDPEESICYVGGYIAGFDTGYPDTGAR